MLFGIEIDFHSSISVLCMDTKGSPTDRLRVRVARSAAEIEELRETWVSLHQHPNSDIDYYLSNLRIVPGTLRPHVLVVYRGDHPDSLLIGRLRNRLSPISVAGIPLPPARVLDFIQGGFLGNQSMESSELLVREIVQELGRGEAHAAELNDLPVDCPLYSAAMRVPGVFCRDHSPIKRIHRRLLLPDNFLTYLSSLSAKERSNVRRHERLLLKTFEGKIRLRRFSFEEVEDLIRDVEEIATKGYQRALGVGFTFADADGSRLQARSGILRGYVLYLADEPCAFTIAVWYKGVLYGKCMGYDPKYSKYSPGQYLLLRLIEDSLSTAANEKTVAIDPGAGGQHYKSTFTNFESQDGIVAIYAPTFRGVMLNLVRTMLVISTRFAKALLTKTHLSETVWRSWRHRALRARRDAGRPGGADADAFQG
jgi:hypothetical protein